jgi:prepilin-type N-terminal cleavage/methylation domain-containing protein
MYPIRIRRPNRTNDRHERGYTLTELAVVMAVFMIFMSFAGPVMISHLMSAVRTERRVDLQQSARAALRTMVRELRQASELYQAVDKPSRKDKISFGIDLEGDGDINDFNNEGLLLEQVTYEIKGGNLWRGRKQEKGAVLAEDVSNLEFTYFGSNPLFDFNGDGVVTEDELNPADPWTAAELKNVTRVQISLTVTQRGTSQEYVADAFLRNRVVG